MCRYYTIPSKELMHPLIGYSWWRGILEPIPHQHRGRPDGYCLNICRCLPCFCLVCFLGLLIFQGLAIFTLFSLLQMMVVDGDSGSITWSYSAPCHMKEAPTTSAVTSDQKSVFLFWAEGLSPASPNSVSEPGGSPFSLCHMAADLQG